MTDGFVKKNMDFILKNRPVSFLLVAGILAVVCFCLLQLPSSLSAQTRVSQPKQFKEGKNGFSVSYPGNWSLDITYDKYAPGLMSADLTNKKCRSGFVSAKCALDCIDIRVLVGKKPSDGGTKGLYNQLYANFLAVKESENTDVVSQMDLNGKKIYRIVAPAPTLSINGKCEGPLYIFETESGYFIYVFAGFGADAAAAGDETAKQIISSINI